MPTPFVILIAARTFRAKTADNCPETRTIADKDTTSARSISRSARYATVDSRLLQEPAERIEGR